MKKSKILVTGSIAYDVLLGFEGSFIDSIRTEALESLSVSYFSPHYARGFGGAAGNIAWYIRLVGGNPLVEGAVGFDGDDYLHRFENAGISTEAITSHTDAPTATAIMGTDIAERQIAFFHPGADALATWKDYSQYVDDLSYAIVSPRNPVVMVSAVAWCHTKGVPVFFDPGQQVHMFGRDEAERLVRMSAAVIVNDYEWSLLKNTLSCSEKDFLQLCPLLIVTRGEDGVSVYTQEEEHHIHACKASCMMNPTGAGDAFRAGLLVGLTKEWSLVDACRLGAVLGSLVVEIDATQLDTLDTMVVRERYEVTYGEVMVEL